MTVTLNNAQRYYLGSQLVNRLYLGGTALSAISTPATILGCTSTSPASFYEIDPFNKTFTFLYNPGIQEINAIGYDKIRNHVFFLSPWSGTPILYCWNRNNNSVINLGGFTNPGINSIPALDYYNNALYAIQANSNILIRINLNYIQNIPVSKNVTTNVITNWPQPYGSGGDVAFDQDGTLYGNTTEWFYSISNIESEEFEFTAIAGSGYASNGVGAQFAGLAFSQDYNLLYGQTQQGNWFLVNKSNGAATPYNFTTTVGSLGFSDICTFGPSITSEPPAPSSSLGLGTYYENYNNSNKDVYVSVGYPISAIIDKSPGFDTTTTVNIISALDLWGQILQNNTFNVRTESSSIYTGDQFVPNPLSGVANTTMVIYISSFYDDIGDLSNVLGFAGIYAKRRITEVGTTQYNIPYNSFMMFNTLYTSNDVNISTANNKTPFYYTVLHEIGHTLGLGTNWYDINGSNTSLFQCFVVGAGDNQTNPLGLGLSANFFYTLQTNPSRTNTVIGKPTTIDGFTAYIGDADLIYAFNNNSTVGTTSRAVTAYNSLFGTNLSAIPLENGGDFGSIASHWEEGFSSDVWGTNNRNYYGNVAPGAPGLNDELMTPLSENQYDQPLSIITLGAIEDLGYKVNYQYGDTYNPLVHNIIFVNENTALYIGFNGNTYFVPGRSVNTPGKIITLKRGLTYTFNLLTGVSHPIYIVTTEGNTGAPPATRITAGVTGDGAGTGSLIWNIPINQPTGTYYLQDGNNEFVSARIVLT